MEDDFGPFGVLGNNPLKSKYALICVNCPTEPGGSPRVVSYPLTRELNDEELKQKREELHCDLGIQVTRVGSSAGKVDIQKGQQVTFENSMQPKP
jgi:hypothetical protein